MQKKIAVLELLNEKYRSIFKNLRIICFILICF